MGNLSGYGTGSALHRTGMKAFFKSYIVAAEKKMLPAYTAKLRKHAKDMGWQDDLTNSVRIAHDGTSPVIVYSSDVQQQINDTEYGTPDSTKKAALRTFMLGEI